MYLETIEPITAVKVFNRLSAKEYTALLGAQTTDRIEWLRQTSFLADGGPPTKEVMKEIVALVQKNFKASQKEWLAGNSKNQLLVITAE